MKSFNKLQFSFFLIGIALISIVTYIFLFRHSGYIYFWDLSGGFSSHQPFQQYFLTESLRDGIEVATKSRLPVMLIIWGIWKAGELLFSWQDPEVIKIAVYLMFTGTFTSFFFAFPKLLKIAIPTVYEKVREKKWFYAITLLLALLYTIFPNFSVRIAQLHLFYFPLFYPLVILTLANLLDSEKLSVKAVLPLVIVLFFGITSPHSLIYFVLTGIVMLCAKLPGLIIKRHISVVLLNFLILAVLVLVTNLYWVLPYIFTKLPEPGYVVNTLMIDLLSKYSTPGNFILGTSDWFNTKGSIFISSIETLQLFGIAALYAFALVGLMQVQHKSLKFTGLILTTLVFLIATKGNPVYSFVYTHLVYSPLGWLVRETNRISMIWWYWIFMFFSFGIIDFLSQENNNKFPRIAQIFIVSTSIAFVWIYSLPIFISHFSYLRPQQTSNEYNQINDVFERDTAFYYVYWYADNQSNVAWLNKTIDIADATTYRSLPYNLKKPTIQNYSVLPYGKSQEQLVVESLDLKDKYQLIATYLANRGVKYIVLDNASFKSDKFAAINETLVKENTLVMKNRNYTVIRLAKFNAISACGNFSALDFNGNITELSTLLEKTSTSKNIELVPFKNINTKQPLIISNANKESLALDLLADDKFSQYRILPFDVVSEFGLNFPWARASTQDKINGEFHNILRSYSINDLSLAKGDKIIYSDIKLTQPSARAVLILKVNKKCNSIECVLWANIYKNPRGGKLRIEVDGKTTFINTLTTDGTSAFIWEKFTVTSGEKVSNIIIESASGFNAVGSFVFISANELQRAVDGLGQITQVIDYQHIEAIPSCSSFQTIYEDGLIPKITIESTCESSVTLTIKNRLREFTLVGKKNSYASEIILQGKQSTVIQVNSMLDDSIWILLLLSFAEVGIIVIYLVYSNEHERNTKVSR